jgi:hypothetical protein
VLTTDHSIGLPDKFRQSFCAKYFNDWTLRHDEGDWPVDRLRARDVVRYQWRNGRLNLQRHDSITITDRADIPGKREHARVELMDDPQACEFISALLEIVPTNRRRQDGTFGVNLFRTFTSVVTKPHHDHEEFIIIYVLERVGDGAVTSLYRPNDVTEDGEIKDKPVFEHQLQPGEIIMLEDASFKHDASPLTSPFGEKASRDALVCTVDYRETYLDSQDRLPVPM